MFRNGDHYPGYRLYIREEMGMLRIALLFLWFLACFTLAGLFWFFHDEGVYLNAAFSEGSLLGREGELLKDLSAWLVGGVVYITLFTFWAKRIHDRISLGQAMRLMAPGLAPMLLFAVFIFAGKPGFEESLTSFFIERLPLLAATLWPFWALKLGRGMAWAEWGLKGRWAFCFSLGLLGTIFGVHAFGAALRKWQVMEHNLPDMGLYTQMVWGGTQGKFLYNTCYMLPDNFFMNGEHAIFSAMLFTPLGWLPDISLGLVLAQSALFIGAAILLGRLTRHFTQLRLVCFLFPALFLISPFIERAWIDDFHIDALEVFCYFALWVIALGWNGWRRWVFYWLVAFIFLGCKEDAGLSLSVVGLLLAFRKETRSLGIITFFFGPVYTYSILHGIPWTAFEGMPNNVNFGKYTHFGTTPEEIAATYLTRPDLVLYELFSDPDRRMSVIRLIYSTGGLVLLAPEYMLLLIPPTATTILSNMPAQMALHTHYGLDFIAPLMVAALAGWRRLERLCAFLTQTTYRSLARRARGAADGKGERAEFFAVDPDSFHDEKWSEDWSEYSWRMMITAFAVLACALSIHHEFAKYSITHPFDFLIKMPEDPRLAEFEEQVAAYIKPEDKVASINDLGVLFAAREVIWRFGIRHTDEEDRPVAAVADVVVLDAEGEFFEDGDHPAAMVQELISDYGFEVEHYWEGYLILRNQSTMLPLNEQKAALQDFAHRVALRRL